MENGYTENYKGYRIMLSDHSWVITPPNGASVANIPTRYSPYRHIDELVGDVEEEEE